MSQEIQNTPSGSSDQVPSGDSKDANQNPSGEPASDPVETSSGSDNKVSYDSYQKLLSEKKRLQDEYQKLKTDAESRKEQELKEQQRFKELYEQSIEENKKLSEKVTAHTQRWQNAVKLGAFTDALGDKKIDSKYTGFIDTDKILINPETNEVDKVSVEREVQRVLNEYPEIVKSTNSGNLPTNAPNSQGSLTYEQWKKLPAHEMKKRRKEVVF